MAATRIMNNEMAERVREGTTDRKGRGTGRRLLWFVGLWAASIATLAVFAYGLRALLGF